MAWAPLLSFWPFCSGVIPSPTPSLSLRAWLQLPTGSCHSLLLPTASCCPKTNGGPCAASLGTSGSWGWSNFPGSPLPPLARGISAECGLDTLFLCLSQLWGPARQLLAVVVAARVAMSRWDSFPCLCKRQQVLSLWGRWQPRGGEGGWWECAKPPAAPRRLWDVSQWPWAQCGSCTPTRCLCGTWRSSSSALPVGGCGNPAGGVSPTHPSLKNTLYTAESSSPRQGFEPQVPPLKVVAVLAQG